MEAALRHFAGANPENDRCVILGDMFELGNEASEQHQFIANLCSELKFKTTFLVGKNFANCTTDAITFDSFDSFKKHLEETAIKESNILIKGSRGMALERTLQFI